jgi:outer membrane protein OmpA-like peptidoglycan-associated protein
MPVVRTRTATVLLPLFAAGCAKKLPRVAPAPAPQPQNIFALLPDTNGRNTGVVVRNSAGEQEISQPDQAVQVAGAAVEPTAPFATDRPTERRLFWTALEALPAAEQSFVLNFELTQDVLDAEPLARIPMILRAIQECRSTNISVTGHTDTTGGLAANYQLGLRRAEGVAAVLRAQGVDSSSLFVTSHGEADPIVKTARGVEEPRNRRVEVMVR